MREIERVRYRDRDGDRDRKEGKKESAVRLGWERGNCIEYIFRVRERERQKKRLRGRETDRQR